MNTQSMLIDEMIPKCWRLWRGLDIQNTSQAITVNAVKYMFDNHSKKAGIVRRAFDGKGFHGLRRRLGKNMLVTGMPVATIAQVLDHGSLDATTQYLALDSQNLKECSLSLDGLSVERSGLQ